MIGFYLKGVIHAGYVKILLLKVLSKERCMEDKEFYTILYQSQDLQR